MNSPATPRRAGSLRSPGFNGQGHLRERCSSYVRFLARRAKERCTAGIRWSNTRAVSTASGAPSQSGMPRACRIYASLVLALNIKCAKKNSGPSSRTRVFWVTVAPASLQTLAAARSSARCRIGGTSRRRRRQNAGECGRASANSTGAKPERGVSFGLVGRACPPPPNVRGEDPSRRLPISGGGGSGGGGGGAPSQSLLVCYLTEHEHTEGQATQCCGIRSLFLLLSRTTPVPVPGAVLLSSSGRRATVSESVEALD